MAYFKSLVFVVSLFSLFSVKAQSSVNIFVRDKESALPIEKASILSNDLKYHAISNSDGRIVLEMPVKDSVMLILRHISYNEKVIWLKEERQEIVIEMIPLSINLNDVNVSANKSRKVSPSLSSIHIGRKDLEQIPAHLGEIDVIKILETQPGVIRTNELNPAINVRGGSGGHNSFVLDGQPIFNPNHLLGILSTFNADLIESASMVKDGYHPQLGGSLSSFIEVKNRIGNKEKLTGKVGIGLLSSRLSLEGPIKKDKISFLFGVRRSYFDLFARSYNNINEGKKDFSPLPEYNFQDYQLKIHAKINQNWFAEMELFRSSDNLDLLKEEDGKRLVTDWSNQFASFHIKHYSGENFNAHFVSGIGMYEFDLNRDHNNFLNVDSKTEVWNNKLDINYKLVTKLELTAGIFCDLYQFKYTNHLSDTDVLLKENNSSKNATYCGAYLNFKYQPSEKLAFNLGGRINNYKQDNWMHETSPRFSITYSVFDDLILNMNYGVTYQFNHLLSTYGMNLPNDIWYPSSSQIPAEEAKQFAIGIEKSWTSGFMLKMSSFFKEMNNVIDYSDGADLLFNKVEDEVILGKGESQGVEVEFNWKSKRLGTTLLYTS
nr:TonB-dependent receptor [uncultured Marinifilum sp.]